MAKEPEPFPPLAEGDATERILAAILERAEPEWEAGLEAACEEHEHLAGDLRARFAYLRWMSAAEIEPGGPAAGSRLGDFLLVRRLGRGGMGVVWLAEQASLGRRVALKLVRPDLLDSERARQRFRREVELASKLEHPGLCTVLQAGEHAGQPWLAMRYVEGRSLAERLEARAVANDSGPAAREHVAATVLLFERVARALHVAHEAGLVHRDVKPENILVGSDGEPVLVDFGLARSTTAGATLTKTGDVLGTPAYLPPELVRGHEADRRGDVYALGVTLYRALTGRLPFESGERERLYRAILAGKRTDPRRANAAISRDLGVVIETSLDPDPRRRYATALDLAEDLRRVRAHEPIRARPASPALKLQRWVQRNPVVASVLGLLALGLTGVSLLLVSREVALRDARTGELVTAVRQTLAVDQGLALRVAVEAHRAEPDTPRTRALLQDTLADARELARLRGHGVGSIGGILASGDGGRLLTWSTDGTARVWTAGGEPLAVLRPDGGWVCSAVFLPGDEVATATADGKVRVFAASGGEARPAWQAHDTAVGSIALAPWGPVLLTAGDKVARLWDLDRRLRQELSESGGSLELARFSPGTGKWIVTGSHDGNARVYLRDATGRYELSRTLGGHAEVVTVAEFSADETRLLTAAAVLTIFRLCWTSRDREARVWDLARPEAAPVVLKGHETAIACAAISPDGERVATATIGGRLRIWDRNGNLLRDHELGTETVTVLAFSAGEEPLLAASNVLGHTWLLDRGGRLLEKVRSGEMIMAASFLPDARRLLLAGKRSASVLDVRAPGLPAFRDHALGLYAAHFSPDESLVVTASRDGTARIFERASGRCVARLVGNAGYVTDARFLPDGRHVLTAAFDKTLRLWDLAGACVQTVSLRTMVSRIVLAPDGSRCYVALDSEGGVQALPIERGRLGEPVDVPYPKQAVWALALSRDGRRLAIGSQRTTKLRVFDTTAWPPSLDREFDVALHETRHVAFSPDGDLLLVGGSDGIPRLYDLAGNLRRTLPAHEQPVVSGAFSRDGRFIATGGGGISLATIEGELVARWGSSVEGPWSLEFTSDGRWLLDASGDGSARLWCADMAELAARARERSAYRELDATERQRFGLR